jgi:hypothetical protein
MSFPPVPPGHDRHLLAIPFEVDFTFYDVVTGPDPLDPEIDDIERRRRNQLRSAQITEYQRRVGLAAARLAGAMISDNPLARHGYLFGNPVEAKEVTPVPDLTGAAYEREFYGQAEA